MLHKLTSRRPSPALVVAVIALVAAVSPAAQAGVSAVQKALFASNAGKVNGIKASRTPKPNQLVALDAKGRVPSSALPVVQRAASSSGVAGPQGPAGPKGDTGEKGDRGAQGERGPQGEKGAAGERGDQGLQGPKGNTGAQGIQGVQGVQGVQGISNYEIVTASDRSNLVRLEGQAIASCPAGKKVIGGGIENESYIQERKTGVIESRPYGDSAWIGRARTYEAASGVNLTVYAICAKVG